MSRKWTILIIFVAVLLTGFAARGPLISTFFEWYLKGYCRTCLGSRLTYQNLYHENGQWVFESPVLTTKSRLEQGGYRCQAERATITVSIAWPKRSLALNVEVESPHIDIGTGAKELKEAFATSTHSFRFFNVHTVFSTPQGTILVHDFSEENLVPLPLFFSVDLACREKKEGCASVWIGSPSKDSRDLFAVLSETDNGASQLAIDFHNIDCSSFHQTLRGLWPEAAQLEITQGTLSGNFVVTFPEMEKSFAEGKIVVENLAACHEETGCALNMPTLILHLFPKEINEDGQRIKQTEGHLEISPLTHLVISKDGEPFWTIEEISGTLSFQSVNQTKFTLDGLVSSKKRQRRLHIDGIRQLQSRGQAGISADIQFKGQYPEDDTSIHFSKKQLRNEWGFGELEMTGFGSEELTMLQHLFGRDFLEWKQLHITKGSVNASTLVYFKGKRLSEVNVENITAYDLEFNYPPWALSGYVENASGSLSFDLFTADPLKTLNMDLYISQGIIHQETTIFRLNTFSNISTRLAVRKGVVQKSLLQGVIAGLDGEIILDGTSSGPLAIFNFRGPIKDLSPILPDAIRQGVDKEFKEGHVTITANADRSFDNLVFTGKILIDNITKKTEEIDFGLSLLMPLSWQQLVSNGCGHKDRAQLNCTSELRHNPGVNLSQTTQHDHMGLLSITQPRELSPAPDMHVNFTQSLTIKNGWFSGADLPLGKFVSPFIFRDGQMHLNGQGNFEGHLNEKNIVVHYDAKNITLENNEFCIEIPSIGQRSHLDPSWPATYVYNFDTQQDIRDCTTLNTFPIHNGTYFEKNSGLLFTEVRANVLAENDVAHFTSLGAFSNGLYFGGSIDLDWSMPGEGVFTVDVRANEMHGKISELQHLLSHIKEDLPILKIPIEGHVSLQKKISNLTFFFNGDKCDLQSNIYGKLADGILRGENVDVSLHELGMNFDYDHSGNTFLFSDIQGAILVGKPNHVEEFTLGANHIEFTDYANNEMEFNIWIGDKNGDLFRLAGKTQSIEPFVKDALTPNDTRLIEFNFDRSLSHFGNIHPQVFQITLKNWSQVEMLQLEFEFQLDTMLADLQKFSRTGLMFLSRSWIKEINDITSAGGKFNAALNYDGNSSVMSYQLSGDDIFLGSQESTQETVSRYKQFLLVGKKKDNLWSVDQMQFDDTSLAFDILKEGALWNINFLGMRIGNSLLLGMEGQYRDDDAHLSAKVNLLEANLADISQWPSLRKHLGNNLIAGELHATGTMHADFDKTLPHGMRCDLKMNGSINQGVIKDISPQDIDNLSLHYNSDSNSLKISLGDGVYSIMDSKHPIKDLTLDWDQRGIKIGGEYPYKNNLFRFDFYGIPPAFNFGEVVITDMTPMRSLEKTWSESAVQNESFLLDSGGRPLIVHWLMDSQNGYCIQKMSGSLCGITFDLTRPSNQPPSQEIISLTGKINVNMSKAAALTEGKVAEGIQNWEFGDGYTLNGQWNLLKDGRRSLIDNISFQGDLLGRDFEVLGYRFYDLSSQLTLTPEAVYIRNMTVSDLCGTMYIKEADFIHRAEEWHVNAPLLSIHEFCPTLLRSIKPSPSRIAKSLNIRQVEIKDLQGISGNRNSFTGNGSLSFINPPKKDLQHTIFAIPAELLTRIGLDLSVLTPVRGTVFYEIKNGKASITRFKDIYSKGRVSKFYLPHNAYDSYVDFDGNVHLQVRMKQYNLIFKLAELFTVTVQGTLTKPTYSLQKQQERNEERSLKEIVQSK
ncbi:MAG: hypothetical protein WCF65_01805 [Parachlamydiaceae bacterium]